MSWQLALSFALTAVVILVVQVISYRRRLRARVLVQIERLAREEVERQLRERLKGQLGELMTQQAKAASDQKVD